MKNQSIIHNTFHFRVQIKNYVELDQKFMQVGIDVTCMYTEFGGRGLSGFGDTATLKNGQTSLSDHGLIVHGHQKI